MSSLPSLEDALVVVTLLTPGFVAIKLFARITAFDRKLSDFDITVYSLLVSLIIYIPFTLLTGLNTLDKVRDSIFQFFPLSLLLSLAIGAGVLPGAIVKYSFRRDFGVGDIWDELISLPDRYESPIFAMVSLEGGSDIMGQLGSIGTGDQAKDILLCEPELILRDASYHASDRIEIGSEVYIPEKEIKRISIFGKEKESSH